MFILFWIGFVISRITALVPSFYYAAFAPMRQRSKEHLIAWYTSGFT